MAKNWMDVYITRLTKRYFDEDLLFNIVGNVADELNTKLNSHGINSKVILNREEKIINFPDCLVKIIIEGSTISFEKDEEFSGSNVFKGRVVIENTGFIYKVKVENEYVNEEPELGDAVRLAVQNVLLKIN